MKNKTFIGIPKGKFERIILSANISQAMGNIVTKSRLEKVILKSGVVITDDQKKVIKEQFSIEF